MAANLLNDRIALLSIIENYGDRGGTYDEISFKYMSKTGSDLSQRQFCRCRKDIKEMFGITIDSKRRSERAYYFVDTTASATSDGMSQGMSCMNAFLLNDVITDDRFAKDRIYIADTFNNELARVVSRAITKGKDIVFKRSKFNYDYWTDDQGRAQCKVTSVMEEVEFTPYALSFISNWFMIGKNYNEDGLRVYSLEKISEIEERFNFGNSPSEFNLKDVLDNLSKELPSGDYDDDRVIFKKDVIDSETPKYSELIFNMAQSVLANMPKEDREKLEKPIICQTE